MKLNHLPLSMIAAACALALTACSSGGNHTDLSKPTAELIKKEQALNAKQAELETASKKLAEEREALESRKRDQTKFIEQENTKLVKAQQILDEKEQELTEKQKAFEQEKAEFEAEKNKPDPITRNKIEVKKGFEPQGTFTKTYRIVGTNTEDDLIDETHHQKSSYVSGKLLQVDNGALTHKAIASEQQNLNELNLDGKTIVLYTPEYILEYKKTYPDNNEVKDLMIDDKTVGKVGSLPKSRNRNDFAQLRYGYIQQDGKTTLFVQGHLTPESEKIYSPYNHFIYGQHDNPNNPKSYKGEELDPMPKEKIYSYSGFAFMGKDGVYKEYKAEGIADFANKKIKIDVKQEDQIALTLGGKISGNTFAGTYQGAVTKGAFYGTAARDAGGTFYQTEGEYKDHNGVFGVAKACGLRRCTEVSDNTILNDFSPEE